MEFLEYANKTHSNIIPQAAFENLTREVFSVISDNLCKSLGPLGASATILDGMSTEATKDGFSILKSYRFHNRYKKMIYNLIMAPCRKMNNTVGDGTTTAIALTTEMFDHYKDMQAQLQTLYRLPRTFIKCWDDVIAEIDKRIEMQAKKIDPSDYDTIYNIAYVTSNGNAEVSSAIAKCYAEASTPAIKQKDSPTNKSYIEAIDGFDFPANLISDAYVKNEDMSTKETNIAVIVFGYKVDSDLMRDFIIPLNEVMRANEKKLLVVAPSFDKLMTDTLLEQYNIQEFRTKGGINLINAQYLISDLEDHQLEDLGVVLRCRILSQSMMETIQKHVNDVGIDAAVEEITDVESDMYRAFAYVDNATLSTEVGSIFKVNGIEEDEKYQNTLAAAKKELEDISGSTSAELQSYSHKIYKAKSRVNQLLMKNYIYYVGADSDLQKNILWDSIDDVIKCIRSAVKTGIVPGCQLSIITACMDIISDEYGTEYQIKQPKYMQLTDISDKDKALRLSLVYLVLNSCIDVYSRVLHGPERLGMIKLLPRWEYTKEEGLEELWKEAIQKSMDIIMESYEKNQVFDLETLEFNPNIVTSAETDRMVLSAASELVKVLISSNQCIVIDAEVDGSHVEA